MIDAVVAGLEQGGNFLIYPAGHIQERGIEEIGPARSVAEILERSPQANLVLVRTRGLWGSSFSVPPGQAARRGRTALAGMLWMLANLIFFMPRKVTMTVEVVRRSDLLDLSREKLNPYLEAWYNHGGPESPTSVPLPLPLGPRSRQFGELQGSGPLEFEKIKPATISRPMIVVDLGPPVGGNENCPRPPNAIGLDSLDRMDTALRIEDCFGFRSTGWARRWVSFRPGRRAAPASSAPRPRAGSLEPPPATSSRRRSWPRPSSRPSSPRAAHPGDVAVADRLSGVLTYRKLLVALGC